MLVLAIVCVDDGAGVLFMIVAVTHIAKLDSSY